MDITEALTILWAILLWPLMLVAYVVMAAIGLAVVTAFFYGLWRFLMWGMSGRRW